MAWQQVTCPVCGRQVSLTREDRTRRHYVPGTREVCQRGSGLTLAEQSARWRERGHHEQATK